MSQKYDEEEIASPTRAWKRATTFQQLCELTAQFVGGDLHYFPCYGEGTLDPESDSLVSYLVAFNRAGFLTIVSQPGIEEQRAFVDGFALEPEARRLARLTLFTDLYVLVVPPGFNGGYHIPVTLWDHKPCTWAGFSGFDDFDFLAEESGVAPEELRHLWYISIIDLRWEREDYLWQQVSSLLCEGTQPHPSYSERPHESLGLETDFVGPVAFP